MDKLSSIRVSGGFSCSLLTRGLSLRIDSLKLEFLLSASTVQQDLERHLAAFYAAVEWPKSSSDVLHVQCSDSNRYIPVCAHHTTYYYCNVGGDCFADDLSCLQIYVYIVHMYKFSCPCIVYLIAEQLRKWVCKIYFLFVLHFKNGWIYLKFILYSFWGGFLFRNKFYTWTCPLTHSMVQDNSLLSYLYL